MDDTATITKKISQAFNPNDESHVLWFKKLNDSTQLEQDVSKVLNDNPFKIKVTRKEMLEWIHIQFVLAMKYAVAVLNCDAWTPSK